MVVEMQDVTGRLAELIERAVAGEEVVIAREDKPAVKLVRVEEEVERPRLVFGSMKHLFEGDIPPECFIWSDDDLRDLGFGPYLNDGK